VYGSLWTSTSWYQSVERSSDRRMGSLITQSSLSQSKKMGNCPFPVGTERKPPRSTPPMSASEHPDKGRDRTKDPHKHITVWILGGKFWTKKASASDGTCRLMRLQVRNCDRVEDYTLIGQTSADAEERRTHRDLGPMAKQFLDLLKHRKGGLKTAV